MCGIIGVMGAPQNNVVPILMERLARLEYRGYDSAGIAVANGSQITRRRAKGKLGALRASLKASPLSGHLGIGHTRWATHGQPNERNAHPHNVGDVSVVHNGIIENFQSLRSELQKKKIRFVTDTDSEVIAALFQYHLQKTKTKNTLAKIRTAARATFQRLEGAYAVALLVAGADVLVAARHGSPLLIGHRGTELMLGSDAYALAGLADELTMLEDGDWALLQAGRSEIYNAQNKRQKRARTPNESSNLIVDKGGHRHFMAKEIFEQSEVVAHALGAYLDPAKLQIAMQLAPLKLERYDRVLLLACGTAYYAAHMARFWLEQLAQIPAEIEIASEYRYRQAPLSKKTLVIVISQSGETADTIAALKHCQKQGAPSLAIVNTTASSLTKLADAHLPILAGAEIGVASTKAFLCQMVVLLLLALHWGAQRGKLTKANLREHLQTLLTLPRHLSVALQMDSQIQKLATAHLAHHPHALYIGRGMAHVLALEGALKLKELSYVHAEGFAAGELKHGSIALIDDAMPVIVIAPETNLLEKTLSNLHEASARGAQVLLISNAAGIRRVKKSLKAALTMPNTPPLLMPLIYTIPLQLLAYHTAVAKGTDVDQPRNLAKSVTVE